MSAGSSNTNLDALVDDIYFSVLSHGRNDDEAAADDDVFPISDEKYAAELQLHEVIMSSAIAAAATSSRSRPPTQRHAATTSRAVPIVTWSRCARAAGSGAGASSSSSSRPSTAAAVEALVFCKICMDAVPSSDAHRASSGCAHSFCAPCLAGYIGAKIQDRIADIKCPEERCAGVLDPALCQGMLPREVFERWGAALCESMFVGTRRTYCPFPDCSEMMVDEEEDGYRVTQSECQVCRRLFCAQCGVPWHTDSDCATYKMLRRGDLSKDDMMVVKMAKKEKWRRCPKCEFFVDKIDGCLHITCRCDFEFCYKCGNKWQSSCNREDDDDEEEDQDDTDE